MTNEEFALLDDIAGSLRNVDSLRAAVEDLNEAMDTLTDVLGEFIEKIDGEGVAEKGNV